MMIAYTQGKTVTAKKKAGEEVNVEVDIVGKYVEKSVQAYFESQTDGDAEVLRKMVERLVEEKLRKA